MRKDVKRSLILWPAVATAIVALMSGYSILRDISKCIGPDTESLAVATQPRFDFKTPQLTNVSLSSRGEHGRRAMELPERVADVFGVPRVGSAGAVSDQASAQTNRNKMAGMILPPWDVAIDATHDNQAAATKPDRQIDVSRLLSDTIELIPPASVLPNSNRTLAKPVFPKSQTAGSQSAGSQTAGSQSAKSQTAKSQTAKSQTAKSQSAKSQSAKSQSAELRSPKSHFAEYESAIEFKPATDDVSGMNDVDAIDLESARLAESKVSTENRDTSFHVTGWPVTSLLDAQLDELSSTITHTSNGEIDRWIVEVTSTLQALRSLPRIGDDNASRLIERLRRLAIEGASEAEKIGERSIQIQWLQAAHAITRRVALWKPIWQLANINLATAKQSRFAIAMKPESTGSVHAAIDEVRSILPETGDAAGWDTYLLLEQIDNAASSGDQARREAIAKQFVSRLERRSLHPAHRKWLEQDSIHALRRSISPWARSVVDYADLLSQIERQEAFGNDDAADHISETMQTLRFSDIQDANQLADSIDIYYRNANIRIALAQPMLQRLVPEIPSRSVPVRTQMHGSRVRGQSHIDSELQVLLVPSINRWTMHLQTVGQVQTTATGVRGPVSVRTNGLSAFTATTPIQISPYGVTIGQSTATVNGRTRLQGIHTDYDGWPVIGNLVRNAAARKFDSMSSQSSRLSNRKIATEIESKVDTEFHQRVGEATERLGASLLGPLSRLTLDPTVVDMNTTEDRLVARYRLAGNDQLAAHTPRPRAMGDSLASVQVHESAINNALEHLVPTDEPTSIRDAISDAIATFGDHEVSIPDDIPDDVTVQFSRNQPITAEFRDDAMWLTLKVVRLTRGDRLNLTKFIVQAEYRPQVNGMQASLIREGHLRISGPGMSMRERLPIRAIFNKVLASGRPLPLTVPAMVEHGAMEGLTIRQLDLRDGWIAMAIAEASPERVATAETNVD